MKHPGISKISSRALILLCLFSCSDPSGSLSPAQTHQVQSRFFSSLEAAGEFKTQALTASYLERKIREWADTGNGEAMRQEIEFARYKHPQLLIDIMLAHPDLYGIAAQMPEVIAFRQQSPAFDAYMNELAGLASPFGEPVPRFFSNHFLSVLGVLSDQSLVTTHSVFDGNQTGVYAQRFNASGSFQGEVLANTTLPGQQNQPALAVDAADQTLIVWQSNSQDPDGSTGVYARRFANTGAPAGPEFRVNSITQGYQGNAAVTALANGDFLIVWISSGQPPESPDGIYARRFTSAGVPLGPETPLTDAPATSAYDLHLSAIPDGGYILAWQNFDESVSVRAQAYDSAGNARGSGVNITPNAELANLSLASAANGDFVLAWAQSESSANGLYAQSFSSEGSPRQSPFLLSSEGHGRPALALANNGYLAAAWAQTSQYHSVQMRIFGPGGLAIGPERELHNIGFGSLQPYFSLSPQGLDIIIWIQNIAI